LKKEVGEMTKTKLLIGVFALIFVFNSSVFAQDNLHATLTQQDKKMRAEYRYKATIFSPKWSETKKTYETKEEVFYFQHWEIDESKKHSSLEQNYLDGSTKYLTEKNWHLKMLHGASFNDSGKLSKYQSYDYSVVGDSEYKIIIVNLNDRKIVWLNYDQN